MCSCSKPMNMAQRGSSMVTGFSAGEGVARMRASILALTSPLYAMVSSTLGHAKSSSWGAHTRAGQRARALPLPRQRGRRTCMSSISSQDISSTPVSKIFSYSGFTLSIRPARRSLLT